MTNKSIVDRKYTGRINAPKRSILRRWPLIFAIFFFVIFSLFAAVTYALSMESEIGGQKAAIHNVMTQVNDQLKQSDKALTATNLRNVMEYRADTSSGVVATSNIFNLLISSRNQLLIYNTNQQLIFSTVSPGRLTFDNTQGNIKVINNDDYNGYLLSQPIISDKTGKVVAYAQIFFNLDDYYQSQKNLLVALVVLAIVTIFAALIVAYLMARRALKPLKKIANSMENVTANPEESFVPVKITREDEIGQIGHFYNEMMNRVNAILERQKCFVSDVSHELRTPIAVIDGNLKMLMRWGKEDPEVLEETLEISHQEAKRMTSLISDMLELSHLEHIPEAYRKARCDLAKAGMRTVSNFRNLHEDYEIDLNLPEDDEATPAKIFENHYVQALTILLDNAIKYTGDGEKKIEVSISSDENFVRTEVRDHGVGISKEDASHVFDRFFRADKARNREIGGTGLGLSIISNLLKAYQGEISLESDLGQGTTFSFKIPKVI